ncbi:MAG: ABC transporter ATP-binding protein [Anaerolineae bacterium]|nr:ABC transporter ATP-binding protein [Anaerolineae bacterium]
MPGPGGQHGARIEKARDVRGSVRRLLSYLRPYAWALIGVFLLVVVSSILDLLGPYFMGRAIDESIQARDLVGLRYIALLMLATYLGSGLAGVLQNVMMARVSQSMMQELRRELFEHLQTLSLAFFDRNPHGELMSRLTNDLDAISRVLSQNVTSLFSGLLTLIGIMIMMFTLNFWLALGSMIVFPLMMWLVGFVGKRTRKGFREYQMRIGQLNGQLEEMFSGQRVIVAFGREASALAEFDAINAQVQDVGVRAQTYSMMVPPLMGILSNANIAILAGLGGWMALQGLATVGTIATFYNYSRKFAAPLRQLGNLYNQIQSALAGAERVFEIIDHEPELIDTPDALPLENIAGDVTFDHVDFSYVPGVPVIKDMSLHAEAGQTIALVGPTGAGKTTIINLLTRFYDIDSGAILIDGHNIHDVQKACIRRQLGIVLQDTFLFTGTVMENIRYGRLDATDDEVIAAATLANADQFIQRLPQGYQTELSERAGNLSQGQRQLLAIARAVLADPRILILDEATSSVDTRTEVRIQEALLKLMEGRTSFVIAHRLSTIRDADKVLVINQGEIIEQGNHEELLAQQGFYYNLYMSQFRGKTAPVSAETAKPVLV